MVYGYYPGCALHGSSKEYDLSVREVCWSLGLELRELDDWNCCGASPAHWMGEELSLALCQRNINRAAAAGLSVIMAPCAACYNRFRIALWTLRDDLQKRQRIKEALGEEPKLELQVVHLVDMLHEEIPEDFKPVKPLRGLKVACYYGCLLLRPPKVVTDEPDPENPTKMEEVSRRVGAEPIEWPQKTCCCGASAGVTDTPKTKELVSRIVLGAKKRGADLIVVACPLCQVNLDTRQGALGVPIIYISQLVGLAMGKGPKELGLDRHMVDPRPVLEAKGVIEGWRI